MKHRIYGYLTKKDPVEFLPENGARLLNGETNVTVCVLFSQTEDNAFRFRSLCNDRTAPSNASCLIVLHVNYPRSETDLPETGQFDFNGIVYLYRFTER